MKVTLVYFAWVRELIGKDEEALEVPDDIATAGKLIGWLVEKGGGYREALGDPERIRIAVNQTHVAADHAIAAGDEVALFPPVTGG